MLSYLFGNKGKDLENIFTSSLDLIKSANLKSLFIDRLTFSGAMHMASLFATLMIVYKWHTGVGISLLLFTLFVLTPYSFFFHIRIRAKMSWLAYAGITGKAPSEAKANEQISKISWSLRFLAFAELLISSSSNQKTKESGLVDLLKQMIISMIATVFDVAENFLLPTMAIEAVSVKDAVPKLVQMKHNVPATLAGAFGIDFIGKIISSFGFLVYLVIMAVGAGVAFACGLFLPEKLLWSVHNHNLFIAPIIVSAFLCSYIASFIKISANSLKAIYFSVFYTSINHPLEITETYRDKVTNYLNFQNASYVGAIKKDVTNIFSTASNGPLATNASNDNKLFSSISDQISQLKKSGKTDHEVTELLTAHGWPQDQIKAMLDSFKKIG